MIAGYATWAGSHDARASVPGLALPGRTNAFALQADFAQAAKEFRVPESVLLAVGYQESLWESHGGQPSVTGNYNVMGLTHLNPSGVETLSAAQRRAVADQRGGHSQAARPSATALAWVNQVPAHDPALHTLDTAAGLIHEPLSALRTSMRASVRAGASLLASYERAALGRLPASPGQWYVAVARYSGATDVQGARLFADRVFAVIRDGATRTTADGQVVTLPPATSVTPDRASLTQSRLIGHVAASIAAPECPTGLSCTFVPAAYCCSSSNYGNYDAANRPTDGTAIRYIVIHDTEGTYSGTIAAFANTKNLLYASAHYVVQSSTGDVTQMVPTKDIAWHAGNWYMNMHSIGIENEGYALQGATWYTPSEYQSSAALVRYLAARFSIPLNRQHIIGHDNVPGPTDPYVAGMHWDPGPYWDWNYFMKLVGAPITQPDAGSLPVGSEIRIDPPFSTANEPIVTGCSGAGTPCPAQPANFVYLRTSPSSTAPLLADPYLHSTGSGTTDAWDWGDKAVSGQTFVVAGEQGSWTAIWYAGQKAWFYNPNGQNAAPATQTVQQVVTPIGSTAIPVYGRASPEASAYPPTVPSQTVTALSKYGIQPGQEYVPDAAVNSDYVATDYNTPEIVVIGTTQYYPIWFNHRLAYVMASDVQLEPAALPPAYTPTGPTRVLDTSNGTGGYSAPVGAGQTISVQVTGQNGVPSSGVTAVMLNVTAVKPTRSSYVTVYADGASRPATQNLIFTAGQTFPRLVQEPVVDGKIDFYNNAGSVNLVADLVGYYSTAGGSWLNGVGPTRVLNTRNGTGGYSTPVGPGQTISLQVTGANGVPSSGVTAVALNVTPVNATQNSYVTVYADGASRPATQNLIFTAGETFPNLVVVPVGTDGKVDFYNSVGSVNLIADLAGYYSTPGGSWLDNIGPLRVLDTLNGTGGYRTPVGPGATIRLLVTGKNGVPPSGVTAVVLNVVATNPTKNSYVTVYPDGMTRPGTSNLNFTAGQTFPIQVVVRVIDGKVDMYNNAGSVNLIADLVGYYMK
ncbi:MAG TPA: peptidoglycan recognition family protein [Streptosporangiaceae bacterium]